MARYQETIEKALAALLGAYCGFYVGVHQVIVSIAYPLPDTRFEPSAPQPIFSLFLDHSTWQWFVIDSFFLIHPGAVVGMILALQGLARSTSVKNISTFMAVGFGVGWIALAWPLTFT
ncbi:MAG: hypothetical protein SFV19_06590 [Rhodospirillaceae bacterium]|nr:hypothetical protein [Rhodospirillaceae bacterium]